MPKPGGNDPHRGATDRAAVATPGMAGRQGPKALQLPLWTQLVYWHRANHLALISTAQHRGTLGRGDR